MRMKHTKPELVVQVGPKKTIFLSLYESCKTKFTSRGRTDVMIQQQKSEVGNRQLTEHNVSTDMTDELQQEEYVIHLGMGKGDHRKGMKLMTMGIKEHHNGGKIIKSLQSAQVGGRGQIAGVLNISVGADCFRR
jgi:hypothetical protein